jgi:hypothetical protein
LSRHSYAGGEPRQLLSPFWHIEDWKSAINYVQSLNASKIILWGVSYSGGQVLDVAAGASNNITAVTALVSEISMAQGGVLFVLHVFCVTLI